MSTKAKASLAVAVLAVAVLVAGQGNTGQSEVRGVTGSNTGKVRTVQLNPLPEDYRAVVSIARGADYGQVTRQAVEFLTRYEGSSGSTVGSGKVAVGFDTGVRGSSPGGSGGSSGAGAAGAAGTAGTAGEAGVGLASIVRPGATVLIKPNIVGPSVPGGGRITDYRVVQELVNLAREAGARRVIVAEDPVDSSWDYAFTVAGYKRISGAELYDLDAKASECYEVQLDPSLSLTGHSWYMPRIWFDADVIIDVAIMKTHSNAGVTLALKNIGIGVPPQSVYAPRPGGSKNILHDRNIDLVIPEINALRRADLYVIDGMVAGEGEGPVTPTPRRMNLVLASRDPVALDTIATLVMGYDPADIAHIVYAAGLGLGTNDPARITVVGQPLSAVRADPPFVRPRPGGGTPYKRATVILRAVHPVKVDGRLEAAEWETGAPPLAPAELAAPNTAGPAGQVATGQVVEGKTHWKGPSDASARFYLRYDDDHLYFAIELNDDAIVPGPGAPAGTTAGTGRTVNTAGATGDQIRIRLGAREKPLATATKPVGLFTFVIPGVAVKGTAAVGVPTSTPTLIYLREESSSRTTPAPALVTIPGAQACWRRNENDTGAAGRRQSAGSAGPGYAWIVEGFIPLESVAKLPAVQQNKDKQYFLNHLLHRGREIAFDVEFLDVDSGEPSPSLLIWSGGGRLPFDRVEMGRALFL